MAAATATCSTPSTAPSSRFSSIELAARIIVFRAAFFRDPWSLFDLFVVGIALVPATGAFSVLRALRILRVLRLVTVVPSLRSGWWAGSITALPGMGSILLLLLLIFYVFSVMAAKLFGATKPELFGNFGAAAYTLFQVMTFDDWSAGIVKPLWLSIPMRPGVLRRLHPALDLHGAEPLHRRRGERRSTRRPPGTRRS